MPLGVWSPLCSVGSAQRMAASSAWVVRATVSVLRLLRGPAALEPAREALYPSDMCVTGFLSTAAGPAHHLHVDVCLQSDLAV